MLKTNYEMKNNKTNIVIKLVNGCCNYQLDWVNMKCRTLYYSYNQ